MRLLEDAVIYRPRSPAEPHRCACRLKRNGGNERGRLGHAIELNYRSRTKFDPVTVSCKSWSAGTGGFTFEIAGNGLLTVTLAGPERPAALKP